MFGVMRQVVKVSDGMRGLSVNYSRQKAVTGGVIDCDYCVEPKHPVAVEKNCVRFFVVN